MIQNEIFLETQELSIPSRDGEELRNWAQRAQQHWGDTSLTQSIPLD